MAEEIPESTMFWSMSVDANACGSRLIAAALMEDLYHRGLISFACEGVSAASDVSEEVPGVDHFHIQLCSLSQNSPPESQRVTSGCARNVSSDEWYRVRDVSELSGCCCKITEFFMITLKKKAANDTSRDSRDGTKYKRRIDSLTSAAFLSRLVLMYDALPARRDRRQRVTLHVNRRLGQIHAGQFLGGPTRDAGWLVPSLSMSASEKMHHVTV